MSLAGDTVGVAMSRMLMDRSRIEFCCVCLLIGFTFLVTVDAFGVATTAGLIVLTASGFVFNVVIVRAGVGLALGTVVVIVVIVFQGIDLFDVVVVVIVLTGIDLIGVGLVLRGIDLVGVMIVLAGIDIRIGTTLLLRFCNSKLAKLLARSLPCR